MTRFNWLPRLADRFSRQDARRSRRPRPSAARRRAPLNLTQLEGRTLPSSFTALTVSDLINDINAANKAGGVNTITLGAPTTSPYVLTTANNTTDGPTGLPVIGGKNGDNLTIVGNGDIIERSTASGTPNFRLFDVGQGGSLTLQNLTLQGGREYGSGSSAEGGAIYNQGTLVLSAVTVQSNFALGSNGAAGTNNSPNGGNGQDASGGGIWSNGSLTLENGTLVQQNGADGGNGGSAYPYLGPHGYGYGGTGGKAFGAGVSIAGGTANLTGVTLAANTALGGNGGNGVIYFGNYINGGNGGSASGGGLDVAGSRVSLCSDTVQNNSAQGGVGGAGTSRITAPMDGGGIDIASGAIVYLDTSTVSHTINNTDGSGQNGPTANIDGTYILQTC